MKIPWLTILALAWLVHPASSLAQVPRVRAPVQEQVTAIIHGLFGQFRDDSTNSSMTYTNLEARFREASALMPERLDLRLSLGTALIGQALQTNTPFDLKMNEALAVYREAHALDTNGFGAALLFAAYGRALGLSNHWPAALALLADEHQERALHYTTRFRRLDELLRTTPRDQAPGTPIPGPAPHAIVILGAAFETNLTLKIKLVDRLQQGLLLARLYPEASIVVTGGNASSGLTEAYAMGQWLLEQGIPPARIHLENLARDTVGNAIRTCEILRKLGVARVTIVTNSSHMRRALAVFEEAAHRRGLNIQFDHLAAKDDVPADLPRERVAVYRDVLRASGLWSYPGIQQ
jgi:hypothetical protein